MAVNPYNKVVFCDNSVVKKDDINLVSALNIAQKVGSIKQMAETLQETNANRGPNQKYNFIGVFGHGAAGVQGLGSNRSANYNKGKDFCSDSLDDVQEEIDTICNSLNTHRRIKPVLFLAGCEAGQGEEGDELLRDLSGRMQDVLIVASEDHLTFKQNKMGNIVASVSVLKLVKGSKRNNEPPEFKFAFNGELITDGQVRKKAGVDSNTLLGELTQINSEF